MSWRQRQTPDRLQVGDEIVTTAGLYGFIAGFGDDLVWVEIDAGVVVRIDRAAVGRKIGSVVSAPVRSAGDRSGLPEAEHRSADVAGYAAGISDNR